MQENLAHIGGDRVQKLAFWLAILLSESELADLVGYLRLGIARRMNEREAGFAETPPA